MAHLPSFTEFELCEPWEELTLLGSWIIPVSKSINNHARDPSHGISILSGTGDWKIYMQPVQSFQHLSLYCQRLKPGIFSWKLWGPLKCKSPTLRMDFKAFQKLPEPSLFVRFHTISQKLPARSSGKRARIQC